MCPHPPLAPPPSKCIGSAYTVHRIYGTSNLRYTECAPQTETRPDPKSNRFLCLVDPLMQAGSQIYDTHMDPKPDSWRVGAAHTRPTA